jgi:hypothetical protein
MSDAKIREIKPGVFETEDGNFVLIGKRPSKDEMPDRPIGDDEEVITINRDVLHSCDYCGYDFGASYPDSVCITGYLWDADSCDEPGGPLFLGGEIPCPKCNTIAFLRRALSYAQDPYCGVCNCIPSVSATIWEAALCKAHNQQPEVTTEWLKTVEPFVTIDWPDRQAVYEGRAHWSNTVERQWPWAISRATPDLPRHGRK